MGCGQKAAQEDWDELEWALEKVGLKNDKLYGHNSCWDVQRAILSCARGNMSRNETIFAIHTRLAAVAARKAADDEIKERDQLAELRNKY